MHVVTRSRFRQSRIITALLPDELWTMILCKLLTVQDVCKIKGVSKMFGTHFIRRALEDRMRIISPQFCLPAGSTFTMAHSERVYEGVRFRAFSYKTTGHLDFLLLKNDSILTVGRSFCDMESLISRVHFSVILNTNPMDESVARLHVQGRNGLIICPHGNHDEVELESGDVFNLKFGMKFEVTGESGVFYEVTYL
jgi:hypothetical protein